MHFATDFALEFGHTHFRGAALQRLLARHEMNASNIGVEMASGLDTWGLVLRALAACRQERWFSPLDSHWPDDSRRQVRAALTLALEWFKGAASGGGLLIATSGTSGRPRLVGVSTDNLYASAQASSRVLNLQPGDRWLNCLPGQHIGSQIIGFRCALQGATMRVHKGFSVASVLQELASGQISHVSLVPTQLQRLLAQAPDFSPHQNVRVVLLGGDVLPVTVLRQALKRGWPLWVGYGATETAAMAAAGRIESSDSPQVRLQPLPGMDICVNEQGFIQVRGPAVAVWAFDAQGRQSVQDAKGWWISADRGIWHETGLEPLGREDALIVTGGKKVHPAMIEPILLECPGVSELAVVGLADAEWGQRLVAFYVGAATPGQVQEYAMRHLQGAFRPKAMIRCRRLPRTATGKLRRAELQKLVLSEPVQKHYEQKLEAFEKPGEDSAERL